MKNRVLYCSVLLSILTSATCMASGLVSLSDAELAQTEGQALFNLAYLAPGQAGNPTLASDNIGFYTLSIEAELSLNANIRKLQLGCGGVNGVDGCDLDIDNFALGCIANASGVCITLPPTGIQKTGANNDNSVAGQQQMRDFVLNNPFFQFAIKNPNTASTREIVGIRVSAAEVKGPMSFGSINSFSGYLTGAANVELRGQGPHTDNTNLPGDLDDVAVTCGVSTSPCAGTLPGNGQNTFGLDGARSMGLDNDEACVLGICAEFKDLTVSFTGVTRSNRPALVNGNRQTQAFISNLNLGKGTNGGEAGVVRAIVDTLEIERSNASLSPGLINFILPLIQGQAREKITQQLATGLGTSVASLDNNTYQLPYNLKNVHQLEIDASAFGLTLSKDTMLYPGFVAPVTRGFALYIPNGFTLDISDKTTTFVQNIASGSAARTGDIVGLPAPYRNCYGTLTFC